MTKWRDEMAAALPGARARSTDPKIEAQAREIADRLCRDVSELPDRTSPDDWPDAMLVTSEELHGLAFEAIMAALSLPSVEIRREALEEAARVADYAVERAERDWHNPDKQDAVKQVGAEIAEVIRAHALSPSKEEGRL